MGLEDAIRGWLGSARGSDREDGVEESSGELVVADFSDATSYSSHSQALGRGPDGRETNPGELDPDKANYEAGETERALDALVMLEAVGSVPPGARRNAADSGVGLRLGAGMLATGLPATAVLDILRELERGGLVHARNSGRSRCFTLTGLGREALQELGIHTVEDAGISVGGGRLGSAS